MNKKNNIFIVSSDSFTKDLNAVSENNDFIIKRSPSLKETIPLLNGTNRSFIIVHLKDLASTVTAKQIKLIKNNGGILFLIRSKHCESQKLQTYINLGIDDFLSSPLCIEELKHRIELQIKVCNNKESINFLKKGIANLEENNTQKLLDMYNDLQGAYKEMDFRKRELETLDKAKSDFIRIVTHEIRSPLNAILGFSQLLKTNLPKEYNQYIESLSKAAQRLQEFSNKAILISQLKTNKYNLNLEPISITYILNSIIERYSGLLKDKNICIRNAVQHKIIETDFKLCERALSYPLENAIRYSPENSNIYIEEFFNNGRLTIMFIDEGPGFSEEMFSNIFGLFAHGEKYIDKNIGLGLYMVKLIMNFLEGSVKVSNNKEGGALVKLTFPF